MNRVYMKHHHNPADGEYGDCLSACVASMLECEEVPHFHFDGCEDDAEVRKRLDDYLDAHHSLTSWCVGYSDTIELEDVLHFVGANNPNRNYILFGATPADVPHAVICRGNEIIFDPSPWPTGGIVKAWGGAWSVFTFAPIEVCYDG